MTPRSPLTRLPPNVAGAEVAVDNAYGHRKRLEWVASRLPPAAHVLEVGCGTGHMIALPLAQAGCRVQGVDPDPASIQYARRLFAEAGLDPAALRAGDVGDVDGRFDAVIVSEVLEHVPAAEFPGLVRALAHRLRPGGQVLVTVPNGYGWFELEAFVWHRLRVGRLLEWLGVPALFQGVKRRWLGAESLFDHPSTLADSPHVRRFTLRGIRRALEAEGFAVVATQGSVLFAGPFSDLLFGAVAPLVRLNRWLGTRLPRLASGFYLVAVPRDGRDAGRAGEAS